MKESDALKGSLTFLQNLEDITRRNFLKSKGTRDIESTFRGIYADIASSGVAAMDFAVKNGYDDYEIYHPMSEIVRALVIDLTARFTNLVVQELEKDKDKRSSEEEIFDAWMRQFNHYKKEIRDKMVSVSLRESSGAGRIVLPH